MLSPCSNGLKLAIKLTPSSSKNAFQRIENDRLCLSVTAAPEKGKANSALIKLLSQKLRLPKSAFRLIAGDTSRLKTILIEGNSDTLCTLLMEKLQELGLD